MKSKKWTSFLSSLLLVFACSNEPVNNGSSTSKEFLYPFQPKLDQFVKEYQQDYDTHEIAYACGWQLGEKIKQQGVEIDAQIVLNNFFQATEGNTPDAQEIQKSMYVLQKTLKPGVVSPGYNQLLGMYFGSEQSHAFKTGVLDRGDFAQGFQGCIDGLPKYPLDFDSVAGVHERLYNEYIGKRFLEENKKKEGVMETPSGLQYEVLGGVASGPKADGIYDIVEVNYVGRLISGKVFDSSYKYGKPIQFALNQVIQGWTEGLQLMEQGMIYRFYVPYELAYGSAGAGGQIPPFSLLIFDVELVKLP